MKSKSHSLLISPPPSQTARIGVPGSVGSISNISKSHESFELFIKAMAKAFPLLNNKKAPEKKKKEAIERLKFVFNRYISDMIDHQMILDKWMGTAAKGGNPLPVVMINRTEPDYPPTCTPPLVKEFKHTSARGTQVIQINLLEGEHNGS